MHSSQVQSVLVLSAWAVLVLPFGFVPFLLADVVVQKTALTVLAVGIGSVSIGLLTLFRRVALDIPQLLLTIAGVPLLLIAFLSIRDVTSVRAMLWGDSFEVETLGALVLFFLVLLAGSLVSRIRIPGLLRAAIVCAAVLSASSVALVSMATESVTAKLIADSWQTLSFLVGSMFLAALALCAEGSLAARLWMAASTTVLGYCFFFFLFPPAAMTAVVIGIVVALLSLALAGARKQAFSLALGAAGIGAALLFLGDHRTSAPMLRPDVRPSFESTIRVVGPLYELDTRSLLLGSGPNSFQRVWERHRTAAFNSTPLWDITPRSGYSTAATFSALYGVLGLFALVFFPLTLIYGIASRITDPVRTQDVPRGALFSLLALSLSSLGAAFVYPIAAPLFFIAGMAAGLCIALAWEKREFAVHERWWARTLVVIMCIGIGLFISYVAARQLIAAELYAQGSGREKIEERASLFERAGTVWATSEYYRAASRAFYTILANDIEEGVKEPIALLRDAEHVATLADRASAAEYSDFASAVYRASLYTAFLELGFPEAEKRAREALDQAIKLSPHRPDAYYALALFYETIGEGEAARASLAEALRLKSDYAEARLFLERLQPSVDNGLGDLGGEGILEQ